MFCKGATRTLCNKAPLLIPIHMQIFILLNKFVSGLYSFGYDCYKIVGSLLNLEKQSVFKLKI